MNRNPNIVIRKVPPAVFLVDITKCYNNKNESLLEIDDMGLAIWNCIGEASTRDDIIKLFLDILTDEKTNDFVEMVAEDVNAFLDILVMNGCVEE